MMRPRGIISPPRSKYSRTKAAPSISPPLRRPTTAAVDPIEQRRTRSDQEGQRTIVKQKPNVNIDNRSSPTSRRSQIVAAAVEKNKNSSPKTATKTNQTSQPLRRSTKATASKERTDSPNAHNRFQKLSIDGKNVASIDLDANSIYEDVRGPDKKERRSSESNAQRRFHNIYKEIASHRQENSSDITSFFAKLVALWDEPASYSEKLSEAMEREIKVMQFLLGLNDSYSTICAKILVMIPFPSVEKAFSLVIQEQKRRELVLSQEIVGQNDDDDGIEEAVDNNVLTYTKMMMKLKLQASPFSQS